ncbi:unnamed protein product [Cochlearia groenlandica]
MGLYPFEILFFGGSVWVSPCLCRLISKVFLSTSTGVIYLLTTNRMFDGDVDCMERGESLFYYIEAFGGVGGHLLLLVDAAIDLGKELS